MVPGPVMVPVVDREDMLMVSVLEMLEPQALFATTLINPAEVPQAKSTVIEVVP